MSRTKAPTWEINTPTSSVSLNILIAALKNVKYRSTRGGLPDIVSLTIFIYASILLSKLNNYAKVDPSANSDSQAETMSNATQREGSKTDRAFLTSKSSGIRPFTFAGRQQLWRKMNSLPGGRNPGSPGADLERRDLGKTASQVLSNWEKWVTTWA